ncbi:ATP-binding protein [Pedobacter sp. GR22-6]|uniref:ATP-binding protein n=1 Tax=Pedobacter sp. GR22-6 TaxID=3127957 RepID=UPI00307EDD6D
MHEHLPFLQGGGQLGELIREKDWSATSLNAPEAWPENLRSAVAIALSSGFPIAIYWGADFSLLYNDAWSSIPGQKHPWALGRPGAEVWPEIWDGLQEEFESVLREGQSYRRPDAPLYMHRYGYTEECYFDYTLSPIVAVDGSVGGVFNAVVETSYRVINERRNGIRAAFLAQANTSDTLSAAYEKLQVLLENASMDVAFFAVYIYDANSNEYQLKLSSCLNERQLADLDQLLGDHDMLKIIHLKDLESQVTEPVSCYWPERIVEALVVPINTAEANVKGYIVLGASARKRIDEDYRQFLLAIAANTGTILNNAFASELRVAYQKELIINAELFEEQQALTEEVTAANEELAASNEELAASNEELAMTNEELSQTQAQLNATLSRVAESERRFQFMLNAIPQQVWTAMPDGQLNYVNQIVANDFGYPAEEIAGKGWQAFIHPDDLPACLLAWREALESGNEYLTEFRLKFANGVYVWHLTRAVPLIEEGKITLWLGTNTNIEAQKQNEQRKDEFLSIASHELKTPLTGIKAFNQLMKRDANPERLASYIDKSSENIHRLEKLINDLLDVTKINAGKLSYDLKPFDFSEMLKDSIDSVQLTTSTHQISLEQPGQLSIVGDRMRLEQVINNFVSNAIKYSPNGKQVLVKSHVAGDGLIVSVKDFGIGIQEQHIQRLFDRYYRIDNSEMRFEGLGLGLFISSEILKRHMGTFWIESDPGKGSTFYFRLPLTTPQPAAPIVNDDLYYKDPHITIIQSKSGDWLEVDWTGFQTVEAVKAGGMRMLAMLEANATHKVMNDNTNVLGTWSEASDWAGQEWFPMMERAGLRYFAWVYSPSAFSRLSAEKAVDVKIGGTVVQFFTDVEAARDWLRSV